MASPATTPVPNFDFSKSPLQQYNGFYLKVIDNVFTPEECAQLIALAESTTLSASVSPFSPDFEAVMSADPDVSTSRVGWQQAALNAGLGVDYIATDYRNSLRILRFDGDAAEKIYRKVKPYVEDIQFLVPGDHWIQMVGRKGSTYRKLKWEMVGINERLSFLKYEPGHFFEEHCDGLLELPDERCSFVTLQIYLGEEGAEGGATRILGDRGNYLDIMPKMGRVLIFQQRDMWHSGREVVKGVKYALRSDFMYKEVEDFE